MFKVHPEKAVEVDMVMMVSEVVVVISVEEVVEATTVETDSKLQFQYLLVYRKGPLKQHNIITTIWVTTTIFDQKINENSEYNLESIKENISENSFVIINDEK